MYMDKSVFGYAYTIHDAKPTMCINYKISSKPLGTPVSLLSLSLDRVKDEELRVAQQMFMNKTINSTDILWWHNRHLHWNVPNTIYQIRSKWSHMWQMKRYALSKVLALRWATQRRDDATYYGDRALGYLTSCMCFVFKSLDMHDGCDAWWCYDAIRSGSLCIVYTVCNSSRCIQDVRFDLTPGDCIMFWLTERKT